MNTPNVDNADTGNLAGVFRNALQEYLKWNQDDMLPAKVVSYDDATNRAVIKPLVMIKPTSGGKVSRTTVPNIPVFRFGGGGFFIRFPIKPGDFGWIKANDRDISLILQRGGQEDWGNTDRAHNFSDAMFFPDSLKDWVIDGENSDAMVIQSLDGSVCVALHNGKITMKAPEMEVDIPKTVWKGDIENQGNLKVTQTTTTSSLASGIGGGSSTFTGNIDHTGNYDLKGNYTHTLGSMTSLNRKIDGTHVHNYTGGTTERPNP